MSEAVVASASRHTSPEVPVAPVRVMDVELSEPLPPPQQDGCRHAFVLVRLHGEPLGTVLLPLTDGRVCEPTLAGQTSGGWADLLHRHLLLDGLPGAERMLPCPPAGPAAPCRGELAAALVDPEPITVVIPTRDRTERLDRCLHGIFASSWPSEQLEILVVDNRPSGPQTRDLVDRLAARGLPCRYLREDLAGSASARNAGWKAAGAGLVVFTDDDTVADRDWLARIATSFRRHPEAGAVTGGLLPLRLDTPAQLLFEEFGGFSRGFEPALFDLNDHRPGGNALYPFAAGVFGTGNNAAFRRDVLLDIGGWDPGLGNGTPALGGEDSEVLLRTVLHGHLLVYEPRALVWHEHRRDYAGLRSQLYSYGAGLSAYLLKTVTSHPAVIPALARKVPAGVRFALDPRSAKNAGKSPRYPRELTRAELAGMLYGPVGYARSRRRYGPHRPYRSPVRAGAR